MMMMRLEHWRNDIERENRSSGRKTCASGTFSTPNVTRIVLALNPDLSGERSATDRQSHGTVSET